MKKIALILAILFNTSLQAQEFLAEVTVNYDLVQDANNVSYRALEKSLRDFINTTKWTNKKLKTHEKIECNFLIIISSKEAANEYTASLTIQSRRPVFGSTYYSPILNMKDDSFRFRYTDFEQLIFNERQFSGKNLTDVIAYYAYLILGYDADTFAREGGTEHFQKSLQIANNSVAQGFSGWAQAEGPRSRFSFVTALLNPQNKTLRETYYQYHRNGLDQMSRNASRGKGTIANNLLTLKAYEKGNFAQFYPLQIFFLAKREELSRILSGGTPVNINFNSLKELLNKLAPSYTKTWNELSNK